MDRCPRFGVPMTFQNQRPLFLPQILAIVFRSPVMLEIREGSRSQGQTSAMCQQLALEDLLDASFLSSCSTNRTE